MSPAYLAKQAATVDVLSGGRLDLGLGMGWMPEEFAATGAVHARPRRPDRRVRRGAARACGPTGSAEFSGEFYTVPRGPRGAAPVQRRGPPVLLGGRRRERCERAGRLADGWVTSSRPTCPGSVRASR